MSFFLREACALICLCCSRICVTLYFFPIYLDQTMEQKEQRNFPPSKYLPVVEEAGEHPPFVSVNGRKVYSASIASKASFLSFLGSVADKTEVFRSTSSPAEYKKEYNKRMLYSS